jgi:hypothetical protein
VSGDNDNSFPAPFYHSGSKLGSDVEYPLLLKLSLRYIGNQDMGAGECNRTLSTLSAYTYFMQMVKLKHRFQNVDG